MSGKSKPSKGFRPLDLMEGVAIEEAFSTMVTLDELLTEDHGDDQEIKVVILSFLLGQTIRKSKIDMQQAVAMCVSASKVAA